MNKKRLVVTCLAVLSLLSGCGGRVGAGKGGIKYIVPFDLPQEETGVIDVEERGE